MRFGGRQGHRSPVIQPLRGNQAGDRRLQSNRTLRVPRHRDGHLGSSCPAELFIHRRSHRSGVQDYELDATTLRLSHGDFHQGAR